MTQIFLNDDLIDKITNFYVNSYNRKMQRKAEHRLYIDESVVYTKQQLRNNISSILSVVSQNLDTLYKPYTAKTQFHKWKKIEI